jgi:hypothetical protein
MRSMALGLRLKNRAAIRNRTEKENMSIHAFGGPDAGMLTTVASIISALGGAMLVFRIQREIEMHKAGEITWIPKCDLLLIAATEISLLLVLLPSLVISHSSRWMVLPAAACASTVILMAGYVPGILAHYRLILSGGRSGPRTNPEPSEFWIMLFTGISAVLAAVSIALYEL